MADIYDQRAKGFRQAVALAQESDGTTEERALELSKGYEMLSKRGQLHYFCFVCEAMFRLIDHVDGVSE